MAKYAILKSFYASEAWQKFRIVVINERAIRDGGMRCEHCGKYVLKSSELTLHHIIELTPENVHDVHIALNPENILVVHHECHNEIHGRFGYQTEKGVYIVYGPPLAGHDDYVEQHSVRGDLVVDMDRLYAAVSMLPYYDKPDGLLPNVRGIHNMLIDNIKTRYGKWRSAWVIGGYADKRKRERLAEDLGAELIFCDVSRDECLARLEVDEDRKFRRDEWRGYIDKWFEQYQP
ncbi:HNH endonuclease [Paenibacillus chibensis]|uniref:HNH endonuclease n=1 Tax=Paenibacillus chibensis TaxID=59846 RepID=A0ABU6PSY8_9BACL|nr:HNH endonuclease [Paenibacillus chibensis]